MTPLRALAAATLATLSFSAHAVGHLADLSIIDRATGHELPVHWHEGRAYVVGKPGNEYRVVVRNRGGEDLLAVVSVDGVNVMNGETASPRQGGYVVAAWSRVDIRGWRKSVDETAAFYFTSLGDSYALRTGRPGNVGVIGAAIFQRKRVDFPPLPAAPAASAAPARSEPRLKGEVHEALRERAGADATASSRPSPAPLGTGHGRREESPMRWVDFERATHAPAETVVIYYDSYRNLLARGILQPPPSPRDPDPSPTAFVPDPPRW